MDTSFNSCIFPYIRKSPNDNKQKKNELKRKQETKMLNLSYLSIWLLVKDFVRIK